jgi:hypothetical protein
MAKTWLAAFAPTLLQEKRRPPPTSDHAKPQLRLLRRVHEKIVFYYQKLHRPRPCYQYLLSRSRLMRIKSNLPCQSEVASCDSYSVWVLLHGTDTAR